MIRVFVHASEVFAASYSSTGASRELIRQALRGNLIWKYPELCQDHVG